MVSMIWNCMFHMWGPVHCPSLSLIFKFLMQFSGTVWKILCLPLVCDSVYWMWGSMWVCNTYQTIRTWYEVACSWCQIVVIVDTKMWCNTYQMWVRMYQMWGRMYQMWDTMYQMWCNMYQMICSMYQIWGSMYQMWGRMYQMWGIMYQVWGSMYQM